MKILLLRSLPLLFLSISFIGIGQDLPEAKKAAVDKFISQVANSDWAGLSESIAYPIQRTYPVPSIENKEDFIGRWNELFDDSLINMISNSSSDSSWIIRGSLGIKMNNGEVWLNLDGKLKEVNYRTESEKTMEKELIETDRETLPVFLQKYERPILQMDAGKWIVRVDQVKGQSYRFVGWIQGNRNPNREAVEIIPNGFLVHGGGGNRSYTFTSDIGQFICYVTPTSEDGKEGQLEIHRDGKLIRSYPAIWVKH